MAKLFAVFLIFTLFIKCLIVTLYTWERAGIATTQTLSLSINTQRRAASNNLSRGTDNSPVTIAGQSRARLEKEQTADSARDFPDLEFRDQQENAGTNRISASEGTPGQRPEALRMPKSIAIRYVSDSGSDANDGLSWSTSKHTIYGALVSLPGGGPNVAGSGTIYVGPGSTANPVQGAGIWLMAASDPNYATPPVGWLKCTSGSCNLNIIGLGDQTTGPNGHKPRVVLVAGRGSDTNHPGIWLSSTAQTIHIANFQLQYPGRAVVIGECSNHDRTGRCGAQSDILDNVGAIITQTPYTGPCTDIVSNVFWIWMRDYSCGGNYSAKGAPRADKAAAILIDGSAGSGSGLIFVNDSNFAGGGIKVRPGSNGGSLYVRNITLEGDQVHPLPPAVWFTGWSAPMDAVLDNIVWADGGPGSMPSIETDAVTAYGPTVLNSSGATGPATSINPTANTFVSNTISPLRQRQTGFFDGYAVGLTDVGRRIAGLVPARFANNGSSSTASWSFPITRSGVTFTQNLRDPYGGTGAAKVAYNVSSQNVVQMGGVAYTPKAEDWIVAGVWAQGLAQNGSSFNTNCYGQPVPTFSTTYFNNGMIVGDGQWQYLWIAEKIASGSATAACVDAVFTNTVTPTLYGPTLYIIPARTLSDNEVLEFASSMNSVDSSCEVGQICNVAGHPIVVSSYRTLSNCSSAASPAKCETAPAGSFVLGVGSTTSRVNTTAVTPNSQILIIEDSSLGTKLGVSCNKTAGRTYMITDRIPGVSFTVSSSFAPADHPACLSYQLLN
jgi:hypothetical protein